MRKLRLLPLALASLLGFAAAPFACTQDQLGSSGAGGSGGGGGAGGDACVPEGTTCNVKFTYPLGGEHSVELRGDFAPGAWEKGVPMTIDGEQWVTSIDAKNGQAIQYKFFTDGMNW